jgi:hypothetical protein
MLNTVDIKDIFVVAARLKRMNEKRYPEFLGSAAFQIDFETLLDLIEKWKKQNDKK